VLFHKNGADNRKAFDVAVNNVSSCTDGTVIDNGSTSSFTVSDTEDVSSDLGVTEAVEFTLQTGDTTVISVGVRLDNCIASFTFQFPTGAGASAQPDEIGITQDGLDKLLS